MKAWIFALFAVALCVLVMFVIPFQVHAQVPSISLDWTATGDDGSVGTAASYQIRWAATLPDTSGTGAWLASGGLIASMPAALKTWWNAATPVIGMPVPKISGTAESYAVAGPFTTGQTYYFILQVCDEAPNCVGSNLAVKFLPDTVPPARIIDFRAR